MSQIDKYRFGERTATTVLIVLVMLLIYVTMCSCATLRRTALVGGGAGGGAAVGSLAGPGGAIVGAVVGGAVASSLVESDQSNERANRLEGRLAGTPYQPPQPRPFAWLTDNWWIWLVALWLWLRRAHLADALTGREPRGDAILRALGLRTHKTPSAAAVSRHRAGTI